MPIVDKIQHRAGTATLWNQINPVLFANEIGVETNTGRFKIGTGTTAWTLLAYGTADSVPLASKAVANGVASLGADTKVPIAQLPAAINNGLATLGATGKVPNGQLTLGLGNGIATLDVNGHVPLVQIDRSAGGVASLGADTKLLPAQMPHWTAGKVKARNLYPTADSGMSNNTWDKVTYWGSAIGDGGEASGVSYLGAGVFSVDTAGTYLFNIQLSYGGSNGTGIRLVRLTWGVGGTTRSQQSGCMAHSVAEYATLNYSTYCYANDQFWIDGFQSSGVMQYVRASGTFAQVTYLGP